MKLTTCGNSCNECRAYKNNYEKLDERESLSKAWEKYIDFVMPVENIHCDGNTCCAVGLGFIHENCQYKKCTELHGVEHCGQCPDYPCSHFDDGRNMTEQHMRDKLKEKFILEEYEKYVKVFDNKSWIDKYHKLLGELKK
ncbi:MAG: DUF3795 domain-containing protein [Bacillota bacterium]|nr:DUF3795 domain-containing protein [Bacillota bacterium]